MDFDVNAKGWHTSAIKTGLSVAYATKNASIAHRIRETPASTTTESMLKQLAAEFEFMQFKGFIRGKKVEKTIEMLKNGSVLHKASGYAIKRVRNAFIVADSVMDLGFAILKTKWGHEDHWVRDGATEVGVPKLHSNVTNARVVKEIMQPLLKDHSKFDKVSINVSSGATLVKLHEIVMKAISDDAYMLENYPSLVIVYFNLNELMAAIPNPPPGTPTHRTKRCSE